MVIDDYYLYNFLVCNFSEPAKASKIKKETIELSKSYPNYSKTYVKIV